MPKERAAVNAPFSDATNTRHNDRMGTIVCNACVSGSNHNATPSALVDQRGHVSANTTKFVLTTGLTAQNWRQS